MPCYRAWYVGPHLGIAISKTAVRTERGRKIIKVSPPVNPKFVGWAFFFDPRSRTEMVPRAILVVYIGTAKAAGRRGSSLESGLSGDQSKLTGSTSIASSTPLGAATEAGTDWRSAWSGREFGQTMRM